LYDEADDQKDLSLNGIDGNEVFKICYKDIAAVVSVNCSEYYDPNSENVKIHQSIISTVMKEYNVLPFGFGNICGTRQELDNFLKDIYKQVKINFKKVKDKFEVGLKIFWKKESFLQDLDRAAPKITKLKNNLVKAAENNANTYFLKLKIGELVELEANKKRKFYEQEIYKPVIGRCF